MIEIKNLSFSYTKKPFIENVSFSVEKGEIFGFLGPSGAGKSTIQKILIGLLAGYKGSVCVNGTEISKHNNEFYQSIGVDFEYPSLYEKLTAKENLEFFSSLYEGNKNCSSDNSNKFDNRGDNKSCGSAKYTPDELLEMVGLSQDANKKVSEFSKGMKSRLNFIKSFIHKPDILFLDEPTSGLDPSNDRVMKDLILMQKRRGVTIIITTHNMEDATELCDRVAFIVDGNVKALDTPHNLIMAKGATKVSYTYLAKDNGKETFSEKTGFCELQKISCDEVLNNLIKQNLVTTIHSSEPTLGDIFMDVTGRALS